MAFIRTIQPSEAEGKLAQIYQRVKGPDGQVDNVLQIHSLRPHSLQGHMALYKSVLHHTGNQLPVWFLECIGVLVSNLNGCKYCEHHHSEGLKKLLEKRPGEYQAYLQQLYQDSPSAPFTSSQSAALLYARKLAKMPGDISEQDIEAMRSTGLSDGEILEVNQVASYFAYANRTVSGLGVSIEGEVLGLSPADSDDSNDWGHD
jgi:uncharacterized peroxidase-related enzyme